MSAVGGGIGAVLGAIAGAVVTDRLLKWKSGAWGVLTGAAIGGAIGGAMTSDGSDVIPPPPGLPPAPPGKV